MSYWANFMIVDVPMKDGKLYRHGEELKATNVKDAIKEAKALTKSLNDKERLLNSKKRYAIYQVIKVYKDMIPENKSFWIDEQSFSEVYPNEEYPK